MRGRSLRNKLVFNDVRDDLDVIFKKIRPDGLNETVSFPVWIQGLPNIALLKLLKCLP